MISEEKVTVAEDDAAWNVTGNNFSFAIEKATGTLKNYTYNGDMACGGRTGSELLERHGRKR